MAKRIRNQEFRASLIYDRPDAEVWMSGVLAGKNTYLVIGDGDGPAARMEGRALYRLAKAIVRRFEPDEKTIRDLAYALYKKRETNGIPGTQDDDWFKALEKLS